MKKTISVSLSLLLLGLSAARLLGVEENKLKPTPMQAEFRTFKSKAGKSMEAKVLAYENSDVTLLRKDDEKRITVPMGLLEREDQEYVRRWAATQPTKVTLTPAKPKARVVKYHGNPLDFCYARTKDAIRAELKQIADRKHEKSELREVQTAVNELNAFRYLCGVPWNVEVDEEMTKEATDAAQACEKHGGLSHSLGHSTEKCNLHSGQGSISGVTAGFISDGGSNNREARGHRRWCLNPPLTKSGYGKSGAYVAMHCMDHAGEQLTEPWAYPSAGYFPKEYLHGNAWSLYLPKQAPAKSEMKVEMWKTSSRPAKLPTRSATPEGSEVRIKAHFCSGNAINFEPELPNPTAVYLVRISGPDVFVQYVVDLY
jgi:uncharacterized protein YkwD